MTLGMTTGPSTGMIAIPRLRGRCALAPLGMTAAVCPPTANRYPLPAPATRSACLTLQPGPGIIATHRGADRRGTQPKDHGLPTFVGSGGTAHAPLSRDHALLR